MDTRFWRRHFEASAARPLPDTDGPFSIPEEWRGPLVASLARFQVGEAGEGRIAREIDRFADVDDDYRAALKLFVREEGRHARILAGLVRGLGGRLLSKNWTERLFVHARRAAGVRAKLVVLLAAEVVGAGFYGVVAERLPAGRLRDALAQIAADEEHHLAFHREFFAAQRFRSVYRWALALVGVAATAVVLVDHRRTLRALGIPAGRLARRFWDLLRAARAHLTTRTEPGCARSREARESAPAGEARRKEWLGPRRRTGQAKGRTTTHD